MQLERNGREPVHEFGPDEVLYRRYRAEHFVNGKLLPSAFAFPKQSVIRSAFSQATDALEPACANGQVVVGLFGVVSLLVKFVPRSIDGTNGVRFKFSVRHDPIDSCYPHSVIWCQHEGSPPDVYDSPSKSVKESFRIALANANAWSIAIKAPGP